MDERIQKLPIWAREIISNLEKRPQTLANEVLRLRKRVEHLELVNRKAHNHNDAMIEMFRCAAKGGNEVAAAVQRIVEDYLICDKE